jgi:CspA family cold shock protein
MRGTVKWWSSDKGYGFVTPENGEDDIFVHYSGIAGTGYRSLENGQTVEFETEQGKKGLQAINVRPVGA